MRQTHENTPQLALYRPILWGCLALLFLGGGLLAWAVQTSIVGAITTQGEVQGEDQNWPIQHPVGGVVTRIHVRDGQQVQAGQVLIELDAEPFRAELFVTEHQTWELQARIARLQAERDGAAHIAFGHALVAMSMTRPKLQTILQQQETLLAASISGAAQLRRRLMSQRLQIQAEMAGAQSRQAAVVQQQSIVTRDLSDLEALQKKGLASAVRLSALRQRHAELGGEIGWLENSIARLNERGSEIDMALSDIQAQLRETAITNLADLIPQLHSVSHRQTLLQAEIENRALRAPVDGVVHAIRIRSTGEMLVGATDAMLVAANLHNNRVAAAVPASDIAQVHTGQAAWLRAPVWQSSTSQDLAGTVVSISPGPYRSKETGAPHYRVEIEMDKDSVSAFHDIFSRPGMPVDVFFRTKERTVFRILVTPLLDYFSSAFRS